MKKALIIFISVVFIVGCIAGCVLLCLYMLDPPKKPKKETVLETTVQTTMQTVQTTVITTTEQITETTTAPMDPEKAFKKWLRSTLYEGGYDDVAVKSLSGYELITIYDELQSGFDEATKFDIAGYPALADKAERDTIKEVAEKHGITEDLALDIYSFMLHNGKDVKKHLNEMENELRKQQAE